MAGPSRRKSEARFVVDGAAIDKLFRSSTGPVLRYIDTVVAHRIQTRAKEYVGVSTGENMRMVQVPGESEPREAHLRDTIVKRFVIDSQGPGVWIGSELHYAKWHHDGTKAHDIYAKKPGGFLRFRSQRTGEIVFLGPDKQPVKHPGTKGTKFLTRAAEDEGLKLKLESV